MVIPNPRFGHRPRPARRLVSAPVAALALTLLALRWCHEDRKRFALAALAALTLVAQLSRAALPPSRLSLPTLPEAGLRFDALPQVVAAALRQAAGRPAPGATLAADVPAPAEVADDAAPPAAAPSAAAGEAAGGAPAAVAAPPGASEGRVPWQPPDAAVALYPGRVERWRPLVRELLAEAWEEGRLDGAAAALDDDLVLALIQQESGGNPEALSWAGAIGLMQVMPFTFAEMMTGQRALTCAIDPAAMWDVPSNVRAGIRYLALAVQAFDGNRYWALAAYNAGIESVSDWRDAGLDAAPPVGGYVETAAYAPAILGNYLRRRPDVEMYVPDRMPPAHVPGALRLLQDFVARRPPRPPEWYPRCGG